MESLTFPLYLLKTSPGELNFWDRTYNFDIYIKKFLKLGIYKNINYYSQYEETEFYHRYQKYAGYYAKTVWLTKEYFNNRKSFKWPLGIMPNINGKWDIHPGGHRSTVIYYFPCDSVLGLTSVYKEDCIKQFTSINDLKDYFKTDDIDIKFHNYPQVFLDTTTQYKSINNTLKHLKNFFNTTHIESNFDLINWGYNQKKIKSAKSRIKVTIEDSTTNLHAIRAFLLMPNFDSFDDYGIKIEKIG
jgi:hypothetical protein